VLRIHREYWAVDTCDGRVLHTSDMSSNLTTYFCYLVLGLMLSLAGCTSYVSRDVLPYPLASDASDREIKVVTIPLPVIASSPNEGITAGALSAFLLHDNNDNINALVAPQVNYNKNFGVSSTLYAAFYPSQDRFWETNFSKSTIINEDYEFRLRDKTFLDRKLEINLFAFAFSDGSARFFGFEAGTPRQRESNYTDTEIGFNLSAGYDIGHHIQVVLGERYRDVAIEPGAVTSIPFIKDRFKEQRVPGINGFVAHAQRISLVYSTLDSFSAPTFGGFAKATVENSSKVLGSTADYRHYEGEIKGFIPLENARYVSVFRLVYNQTLGNDVPFLEQSILGGENTLRGYGRNRFIDNSFFLLNLEERIRLFRWEIFNVKADWEIAPFIDLGAVMSRLDRSGGKQFEFNPGIGLRAVVRPNIIGRIDVGIGHDGPAVFVGLGYPF
jgi:Omp85 superfamily domain